jgi:hypothetical protein
MYGEYISQSLFIVNIFLKNIILLTYMIVNLFLLNTVIRL